MRATAAPSRLRSEVPPPVQPARHARFRLAAFVGPGGAHGRVDGDDPCRRSTGVQSAGRPAWDRETDDAVRLVVTFREKASARCAGVRGLGHLPRDIRGRAQGGPSSRQARPPCGPRSVAWSVIRPSARCRSAIACIGRWIPRTSSSGTRSGASTTRARPSEAPRAWPTSTSTAGNRSRSPAEPGSSSRSSTMGSTSAGPTSPARPGSTPGSRAAARRPTTSTTMRTATSTTSTAGTSATTTRPSTTWTTTSTGRTSPGRLRRSSTERASSASRRA